MPTAAAIAFTRKTAKKPCQIKPKSKKIKTKTLPKKIALKKKISSEEDSDMINSINSSDGEKLSNDTRAKLKKNSSDEEKVDKIAKEIDDEDVDVFFAFDGQIDKVKNRV